ATHVIQPVLPAVQVKKVKTKEGRRFDAPRILWNVYEAQLELPGGIESRALFWTKAFFRDDDCEAYRHRIEPTLSSQNGNPLDPRGHARFFPDLNLFLFLFPTDPIFPALPTVYDGDSVRPILEPTWQHLRPEARVGSVTPVRVKYFPESSGITAGTPHTVDVEIDRLLNRLEEFKMSSPTVYLALRDLLKQISAKADRVPPEAPVPSHGDYKYNQFLYDGTHFGLIDVEYF